MVDIAKYIKIAMLVLIMKPELIAGAASLDHLKAAIEAGADACYLGVKEFNARINAPNFTFDELKEGCKYAHIKGRRVFLTLNILIKDSEMQNALDTVRKAWECGIDAVILQDLGLAKLIHEHYSEIRMHASTQISCHNYQTAKLLAEKGFKRVVLAREVHIDEVRKIISKTDLEIETFVHGAMCFCYSGQCYMSSVIFDRSGNRGLCAQPCRLPYTLRDSEDEIKRKGRLMSLRDMSMINDVKELTESGIHSFKIEGRMKSIEYVYHVVRVFRKMIDEGKIDRKDFETLKIAYNRDFCSGYYFSKEDIVNRFNVSNKGLFLGEVVKRDDNGSHIKLENDLDIGDTLTQLTVERAYDFVVKEIFVNGKKVLKAKKGEIAVLKRNWQKGSKIITVGKKWMTDEAYSRVKKPSKIDVELRLFKKEGIAYLEITGLDKKIKFKSDYEIKEAEKEIPLKTIEEKVGKLGGTLFYPVSVKVELDKKDFIPLSILNGIRRDALAEFERLFFEERKLEKVKINLEKKKFEDIGNVLFLEDLDDVSEVKNFVEAKGISNVKINYDDYISKKKLNKGLIVKTPVICDSDRVDEIVKKLNSDKNIDFVEVSNLGFVKGLKKKIILGQELNIFNSYFSEFFEREFVNLCPSKELKVRELKEFISKNENCIVNILEYKQLMVSKYCLVSGNNCTFDKKGACCKGDHFIEDRKGFEYRVLTDSSCNSLIFNPKYTYLEKFEKEKIVKCYDVRLFNFDRLKKFI